MGIFKVFEDFRFISQLREEMEKVSPLVAIVPEPICSGVNSLTLVATPICEIHM